MDNIIVDNTVLHSTALKGDDKTSQYLYHDFEVWGRIMFGGRSFRFNLINGTNFPTNSYYYPSNELKFGVLDTDNILILVDRTEDYDTFTDKFSGKAIANEDEFLQLKGIVNKVKDIGTEQLKHQLSELDVCDLEFDVDVTYLAACGKLDDYTDRVEKLWSNNYGLEG